MVFDGAREDWEAPARRGVAVVRIIWLAAALGLLAVMFACHPVVVPRPAGLAGGSAMPAIINAQGQNNAF